jgi:hypothetical protein
MTEQIYTLFLPMQIRKPVISETFNKFNWTGFLENFGDIFQELLNEIE